MQTANPSQKSQPIFLADSCIGGMSVLKSLWSAGVARNAVFMADYAVNPLGMKSDSEIANVVAQWIAAAEAESDVLICACNTLSIRYQQLIETCEVPSRLKQIISMVDCFKEMIASESERLTNQRVLVIGTSFTASQSIYPELLQASVPGVAVNTVAATKLERAIARFQPWDTKTDSIITMDLRAALVNTDFAILACTCFPMAKSALQLLFPEVQFLDPGEYCAGLLKRRDEKDFDELRLKVTGDVVAAEDVDQFARLWLGQSCLKA